MLASPLTLTCRQMLSGGSAAGLVFTPHLVPMTRGVLATAYCRGRATTGRCLDAARRFYAGRAFVRVTDEPPQTKWATGSNLSFVSYAADPERYFYPDQYSNPSGVPFIAVESDPVLVALGISSADGRIKPSRIRAGINIRLKPFFSSRATVTPASLSEVARSRNALPVLVCIAREATKRPRPTMAAMSRGCCRAGCRL